MAFEKERTFYSQHREQWLPHYEGKFAVIKDEELIGAFTTAEDAYQEAVQRFGIGNFLIIKITGDDSRCPSPVTLTK